MSKRKRSAYEDDGGRIQKMRHKRVQDKLTESRKLLHRALKTAKGFERQKLGKRLKLAKSNGHTEDVTRINREIEALKGLDLGSVTNAHLHKTLLKIKAFSESQLLPDEVKRTPSKPEGSEDMVAALYNVTSGIYNMRQVKDTMNQIVKDMHITIGVPAPVNEKAPKGDGKGILKTVGLAVSKNRNDKDKETMKDEVQDNSSEATSWDGFDSNKDQVDDEESDGGIDEEELSRYDTLIGASSDEESFDRKLYIENRSSQTHKRLSLSLSPTPSRSPTPTYSPAVSSSPVPEEFDIEATRLRVGHAPQAPKPKLSTFLPTLMGGYWSGSESSASDIENAAPVRKNRPGQMARRAIWEKKYGKKANHIKTGKGPVGKGKDDGWDPKRGAKDDFERGRRKDSQFGQTRSVRQATGENAIAVEPKKRGAGKKDDAGILHPSWQAAKKAKEIKSTAKFQGKKVTFD